MGVTRKGRDDARQDERPGTRTEGPTAYRGSAESTAYDRCRRGRRCQDSAEFRACDRRHVTRRHEGGREGPLGTRPHPHRRFAGGGCRTQAHGIVVSELWRHEAQLHDCHVLPRDHPRASQGGTSGDHRSSDRPHQPDSDAQRHAVGQPRIRDARRDDMRSADSHPHEDRQARLATTRRDVPVHGRVRLYLCPHRRQSQRP